MKRSLRRAIVLGAVPLLLALGAGSASAQTAGGNPPPPKGFEADSASFVSARTGFVLGARGCSRMPCKARLDKTVNGGKTWTTVPVPAVELVPPFTGSPLSAVSAVRFENAQDGWLFGPGLWATTDGGEHWHRVILSGEVIALAASDGEVFAAVQPVNGGLLQATLYKSEVGTTKWSLVAGVSPDNALTVSGHSVWAGISPKLWTSTDSGEHWSKLPFTCPAMEITPTAVAAASSANVAIACSDVSYPLPGSSIKVVFTSSNGGRTFHRAAGQPGEAGNVGVLAMPPGRPQLITLTASSGATFLYQSVNGGSTWSQQTLSDGGLNVRDLAYVSATTGYLVHFGGGPVIAYTEGLMKTTDAGASWETVTIP